LSGRSKATREGRIPPPTPVYYRTNYQPVGSFFRIEIVRSSTPR
jgi:hypothetical protein